jgi:5-oxoprolinase (ATP-hydrolysing) subunit A
VVNTVDLNADLGEGFGVWTLGDDNALLEVITSANVACGFHAGDALIMRTVCTRAAGLGVRIGAQVSYNDRAGFGRRAMQVPSADLQADIIYQIGALDGFARAAGDRVRYVKPHGALYNTAMVDEQQAGDVAAAVAAYSPELALLGLPGSRLAQAAARYSLPFINEAFADRAYTESGQLVPRGRPGAVLTDPVEVVDHALALVAGGAAQSLCLHGDTPGAADLAGRVRAALVSAGVTIQPFR